MSETRKPPVELHSGNWLGKASAGVIMGFTLALALTSIFGFLFRDEQDPYFSAQGQFAMWMMSPIWMGILSSCFFFPSGKRAWAWLGGANLLAWATFVACRLMA